MDFERLITTEERLGFTFNAAGRIYAAATLAVPLVALLCGAPWRWVIGLAALLPAAVLFLRFCASAPYIVDVRFPLVKCPTCGSRYRQTPDEPAAAGRRR